MGRRFHLSPRASAFVAAPGVIAQTGVWLYPDDPVLRAPRCAWLPRQMSCNRSPESFQPAIDGLNDDSVE